LQLAGIPERSTSLGARGAPGTIVEFTDLLCRPCHDFELAVLPTIVQRYVRPGKLRLELRVIALEGPGSLEAAAWAAAAARQNRLYGFVDDFFRAPNGPDPAKIASLAGLDVPRARRYAGSGPVKRALARTSEQARGAGITSLPAFYVSVRGGPQQPFAVRSQTPNAFTGPLDRLLGGP
jgi:protein-disulfide isomerase